eukprot:2341744-Prymnesium_polylepis.1
MRREDGVSERPITDDAGRIPQRVVGRFEARHADRLQRRARQMRHRHGQIAQRLAAYASRLALIVTDVVSDRLRERFDEARLAHIGRAHDEHVSASERTEDGLCESEDAGVGDCAHRVRIDAVDAALSHARLHVRKVPRIHPREQIHLADGEDDRRAADGAAQRADHGALKVSRVDDLDAQAELPPRDDVLELLLEHGRVEVLERVVRRPHVPGTKRLAALTKEGLNVGRTRERCLVRFARARALRSGSAAQHSRPGTASDQLGATAAADLWPRAGLYFRLGEHNPPSDRRLDWLGLGGQGLGQLLGLRTRQHPARCQHRAGAGARAAACPASGEGEEADRRQHALDRCRCVSPRRG